ncbi:Hypothetical_protein [Hexamita inflata]|uniref:Hypothetical_protein n=1 Tax=Hexamita inflata TaxID=28002 RepID=A0AA86URC5_9EUKA|nr:Hypothetical protein HINF_LOCUS52709 [Hexamita inflata]
MSDEKISKMVNKKQENKINYNISKLKSQYNLQKGIIYKLESQILNPDQVQELKRSQDFEIQQKDEIISQCKSELIQLHNTMFQYKEYSLEKSDMLLKQQEELILFQTLREQYLNVLTNSQHTQTIPKVDKPNKIIVQRYTEDQKTEGLLRLIRDGPLLYKKQQNMNNYLPNIQGLMYFKQQLEIKISSQNNKFDTQNSKNTQIQVDNINLQAYNTNKQINTIRKQLNNLIQQIETVQKLMTNIKTSQYILNENENSQNLINNLMSNQQSRIIQQIDNVQYQMNIVKQLIENICKQQLQHNQISIYTSKK